MVCQTRNPNPISRLIGPRGAGPTIYIPYSFPAETLKARVYNNVLHAEKLSSHLISIAASTPSPCPGRHTFVCPSSLVLLYQVGEPRTGAYWKRSLIRVVFFIRSPSCNSC